MTEPMPVQGVEAYPLYWPEGWKRTTDRNRHRADYRVGFAQARDELLSSLRLMGARHVVISSNVPLRLDGLPFAKMHEPKDPGVAVYWTSREGAPCVMACDSRKLVRENLRAIGLSIAAMRAIERAGASQILERAFFGFSALPASTAKPWREVLGVNVDLSRDAIERAYRAAAARAHPDAGGTAEQFHAVAAAREEALRELQQKGSR